MQAPSSTVFYQIEQAIKTYRRFAQANIQEHFPDLTLDQTLILLSLDDNPELSLSALAEILFRENASITRMVESMVKKNYLERTENAQDRRKYDLRITEKAQLSIKGLKNIIISNRMQALSGLSEDELEQLSNTLQKLTQNTRIA